MSTDAIGLDPRIAGSLPFGVDTNEARCSNSNVPAPLGWSAVKYHSVLSLAPDQAGWWANTPTTGGTSGRTATAPVSVTSPGTIV